jgi:hypothetical protein
MQKAKKEQELNTNLGKKRNHLYVNSPLSPGSLISKAGGNGTIDFKSEVHSGHVKTGDISFESNKARDYDLLGIAEVGNLYHLHVKTYLMRYAQQTNQTKRIQLNRLQGILSLQVKMATINEGVQSLPVDAALVIFSGIVVVLRQPDLHRAVPTFGLDSV